MNLYIIESPLQLLCAFEAINSQPTLPYKLFIRKTGRGLNDIHLESCAAFLNLSYQSFVLRPEFLKVDIIRGFNHCFSVAYQKYETVYLGSYYSAFMKAIRKIIRADNFFYLDDGAATLRAQIEIQQNARNKINWFTFFNLTPVEGQIIHTHHFDFLRQLSPKTCTYGSYFIGQPVERMIGFTKNKYKKGVALTARKFNKKNPLIYIPHRIEDITIISDIQNVKIIKPDVPLELYFLDKSVAEPLEIYSFYSTALVTLKEIFPNINAYSINNITETENNSILSMVYKYYRNNGIKEIDL